MDTSYLAWYGTLGAILCGGLYWYFGRNSLKDIDDIQIPMPKPLNLISNQKPKLTKLKGDGIPLKILFYSQTGTADDFSNRLGEDLSSFGFSPEIFDVENYEKDNLSLEKIVIFIVSTYGEGDPPDNAQEFHRWIMDPENQLDLSGLKFAVFGLGNKTYDNFNKMGKDLDNKLEELGAKKIFTLGLGDDDVNIEKDFLSWKKEFGVRICQEFSLAAPVSGPTAPTARKLKLVIHKKDEPELAGIDVNTSSRWKIVDEKPKTNPDIKNPFLAQILITKELHSSQSERSCLHVEISTHDGTLNYLPGDHLGLYAENDLTMVHKLCAQIKTDPETIFSVHNIDDQDNKNPLLGPITLKTALLQIFDVSSVVRKAQLKVLSQYAKDDEEKARLLLLADEDPEKQELYEKYIIADCRCLSEILKEFKSVEVPLDHFLESLTRLQPRYYSISSSPNLNPGRVNLTAVLVDYVTPTKRSVKGVCTGWLATHRADPEKKLFPRIPAFIRKSNFKLPATPTNPIIMVGPGTGLAPFRGFIQERAYLKSKNQQVGEAVFFFGCRHPDKDFIYKDEIESYQKEGALSHYIVAFSRYLDQKAYVQHKMVEPENAELIWKLLNSGANFYVCGDAKFMARDVQDALTNIVIKYGGKSKEEAVKLIEKMQSDQKYQSDVWS